MLKSFTKFKKVVMILLWCSLCVSVFQVNLTDIPEEVLERYRRRVYFVGRTPRPRAPEEEFVEPVPVEQPPGFVVTDSDGLRLGGPEGGIEKDRKLEEEREIGDLREAVRSQVEEEADVKVTRARKGNGGRRNRVPSELVDVEEKVTRKPGMELEKGRIRKRPNAPEKDEEEKDRKKPKMDKDREESRRKVPTVEETDNTKQKEKRDEAGVRKRRNPELIPGAGEVYDEHVDRPKGPKRLVEEDEEGVKFPTAAELAKAREKERKDEVEARKRRNLKQIPRAGEVYDEHVDRPKGPKRLVEEDEEGVKLQTAAEIAKAREKETKGSKRVEQPQKQAKDYRQEPLRHDSPNQDGANGWTIPNRMQLNRAVQKDDVLVIEGQGLEAVKSCRVCDVTSNPLSVTSNAVECPIPKKARGQCSVKLSNGNDWSDESIFFNINYTSNWTQITVIIALLCCGIAICCDRIFRAIGRPLCWKPSQPGNDVEDERTPFLETSSEIVQE